MNKLIYFIAFVFSALFVSCVCAQTDKIETIPAHRFIKLDQYGAHLPDQTQDHATKVWACVFDSQSKLTWEVKSRFGTINKNTHTYSWYNSDHKANGGFAGLLNNGQCSSSPCNTQAFVQNLSRKKYCGLSHWRVPNREELRGLVDYTIDFPGPAINSQYFPNTISQFYWSVSPDASSSDSAWGIGFTFGYDYSYFKADRGHVRLVHDEPISTKK